jgi:hypothetical protein
MGTRVRGPVFYCESKLMFALDNSLLSGSVHHGYGISFGREQVRGERTSGYARTGFTEVVVGWFTISEGECGEFGVQLFPGIGFGVQTGNKDTTRIDTHAIDLAEELLKKTSVFLHNGIVDTFRAPSTYRLRDFDTGSPAAGPPAEPKKEEKPKEPKEVKGKH